MHFRYCSILCYKCILDTNLRSIVFLLSLLFHNLAWIRGSNIFHHYFKKSYLPFLQEPNYQYYLHNFLQFQMRLSLWPKSKYVLTILLHFVIFKVHFQAIKRWLQTKWFPKWLWDREVLGSSLPRDKTFYQLFLTFLVLFVDF